MAPFHNIVSGVVQSKRVATVIYWTGSISYCLSAFWFMCPLRCWTVVPIFYQRHITDFPLTEHLQWFKPSQVIHPQAFTEIIYSTVCCCFYITPHLTFTPKMSLCFIPLVSLEVLKCCPCCFQWCKNKTDCSNRINQRLWIPQGLHNVGRVTFALPNMLIWFFCAERISKKDLHL